ncbi:MAG TPA: extracellular solute-binding protein [Gemmatimonadaceae bacterium]|nr:extracellular solute-binding protein [Gemmatimonadaceae bacterium]
MRTNMISAVRRGLPPLLALLAACTGGTEREAARAPGGPAASSGGAGAAALVVFNAGSLARPLRAALDTFAAREHVRIDQESAGSLESARKLTELGKIPDVIALADWEVFPQLLVPEHVSWYVPFARNRMVVAYSDRSRHAGEIGTENWWRVLQRPDVEVGRADPNLDPNGYRTLLTLQLAERHYRRPGLAERLLARSPRRNMRPKEADLVGLLQAGELDYIWSYESIAQGAKLRYVRLPHEIDLGSPEDSALYARASVRVAGRTPRDSVTFRGSPIVYALSIPKGAPHPQVAERFVAWLLGDGRAVLRAARLDALEHPVVVGTGAPAAITAAAPSGAR